MSMDSNDIIMYEAFMESMKKEDELDFNFKEELYLRLKNEGLDGLIVDNFEEARTNSRTKNIVLTEDSIHFTFKVRYKDKEYFGELICWNDDEVREDNRLLSTIPDTAIDLYSYETTELTRHILKDDLIEIFEPYDIKDSKAFHNLQKSYQNDEIELD